MELKTWERKGYTVEMVEFDGDLKQFEIVQGDTVQTITPGSIESMNQIIEDLNNGEDVDGWEDGNGNVVVINQEEESKMEKVFEVIQEKFLANGENERYVEFYSSESDVEDEMDLEIFEETFDVDASSLSYPVITFDDSNAIDGHIFESGQEDEILSFAENYLERK